METDEVKSLKKQADEINISFSELIRQKLKPNHHIIRTELILDKILNLLEKNGNK
ncbi:MAG: hypothetical protein WC867_06050 [Candidatus Pacearchaeota archaeon]|jgi:hypothetical protein